MPAKTPAERYFAERMNDPIYAQAYARTRKEVNAIDSLLSVLDGTRSHLGWSKAELARKAELPEEVVRRLFSAKQKNPTLRTIFALAHALGLELLPMPSRCREASQKKV